MHEPESSLLPIRPNAMATGEMPRIPDPSVAQAILGATLGATAVSVERFTTGSHHYVYDCRLRDGRQAVVRIADAQNRRVMADAADCSDLLRPLGVPLPEIVARGVAGELAYLVLARLPGTDLGPVIDRLSVAERLGIAAAIARIQAIVAALSSAGRYGHAVRPQDAPYRRWSEALHASLDRSRARIDRAGLMDAGCVERVRAIVREKEALLDARPATCFLHDTTTKNVIVHEGRLSGIVDVDDFCFGDPLYPAALTLMSLLQSRGPVDYVAAWLDATGVTADWRLALYTAIFCVDFMAEHGQVFNGNMPPSLAGERARLEALLARLLDACGCDGSLSIAALAVP